MVSNEVVKRLGRGVSSLPLASSSRVCVRARAVSINGWWVSGMVTGTSKYQEDSTSELPACRAFLRAMASACSRIESLATEVGFLGAAFCDWVWKWNKEYNVWNRNQQEVNNSQQY